MRSSISMSACQKLVAFLATNAGRMRLPARCEWYVFCRLALTDEGAGGRDCLMVTCARVRCGGGVALQGVSCKVGLLSLLRLAGCSAKALGSSWRWAVPAAPVRPLKGAPLGCFFENSANPSFHKNNLQLFGEPR